MDEEAAFPDLTGYEFFQIILESCWRKLKLPDKFATALDGREPRELKLREAGGGRRLWDVEVVLDGKGRMYLGRGWEQFARAHDLRPGYFLVFSYDGDVVLTVKVFDESMCRKHYQHDDDDDDGSGSSGDTAELEIDTATSQFSVMLRQCHLGVRQKQYLNVPAEFQSAHRYASRSKVVLEMRGGSWTVNLKHYGHNITKSHSPRTALRYGWYRFCVDNGLGVGDTCFFRALREGDASRGDEHVLKVEVRKRDGTFIE